MEILLRLAWTLGVRMCPHCPRCNNDEYGHPCQDKFGSPSSVTIAGVDLSQRGVLLFLIFRNLIRQHRQAVPSGLDAAPASMILCMAGHVCLTYILPDTKA